MRMRRARRGALAVEAAVVYPVLFLLLAGLVVGGLTVFRHQQVALLAREAARHVSVRGAAWARATSSTSPSAASIRSDVVLPLAPGADPADVSVRVEWVDKLTGQAVDWDQSSKEPTTEPTGGGVVTNEVRVTVRYKWSPGLFPSGLTLTSVAVVPMGY